jgi:hypothetical protein
MLGVYADNTLTEVEKSDIPNLLRDYTLNV